MGNASVTITDGLDTVDITNSSVKKTEGPRRVRAAVPGRVGNVIQPMGTTGFSLRVSGYWITQENYDIDYRQILTRWRRNNTIVLYDDGAGNNQLRSNFTIRDFNSKLISGQPGLSSKVEYEILLAESQRIYVDEKGANIITGIPWNAGQALNSGALNYGQEEHTFTDSAGRYWVASVVSSGGTKARLSLWMSSNGAEWFWGGDLGANVTHGSSIQIIPPTSVGAVWADQHTLKYAQGNIGASSIVWQTATTLSTGVASQDNYYPFLYISSSGRRLVTANTGSVGFSMYDSTDGASWAGRASYTNVQDINTFKIIADPNRYSICWESFEASTPKYVKRIAWHANQAVANVPILSSVGFYGPTEGDYSNTDTGFAQGFANAVSNTLVVGSMFSAVSLPFTLTSIATVYLVSFIGGHPFDYNIAQKNVYETAGGSSSSLVISVATNTVKKYITASRNSASSRDDVYWVEGGVIQHWDSVSGIQQSPAPFGTTSVGEQTFSNTSHLLRGVSPYVIWRDGNASPYTIKWGQPQ